MNKKNNSHYKFAMEEGTLLLYNMDCEKLLWNLPKSTGCKKYKL